MSSFSVGGLSSGLDTKAIIDQLMQIESRPKTQLDWKQQLWSARKAAWTDLNSRLLNLQNLSNALLKPEVWNVASGGTSGTGSWSAASGDPSRLSATVTGAAPAAGTYAIDILQLAKGEISLSSGSLGPATSGQRTTGVWYEGLNNKVEGTENITALRTSSGAGMGLNTNSTITMNYNVNGVPATAAFKVNTTVNGGQGTNLTEFRAWIETTIGNGATAAWNAVGELEVTTAPGTANELTDLSFTAVNAANANLPAFNSSVGASTSSSTVAASNGGVLSNHNMTIQQGSNTWNIALSVGDQKIDIVNKINAAGIGVSATMSGSDIRLSSTTIGAASGFTVSGAAATMLNFTETQSAQDAQYSVNGTQYSSASNMNVAGVIADVSLNLLNTTSTTLTVGQGTPGSTPQSQQDKWIAATKQKITDFINQYNSVQDLIYQKTQGESRAVNPKNLGEYLQGPMARNNAFSSVGFDLRQQMGTNVQGLAPGSNFLSDIGINTLFSVGGGSSNGKLGIDDAKLEQALRDDPTKVQALLTQSGGVGVSADDGIVRRMSEMVSQLRVGGRVDNALSGAGSQIKSVQQAVDRATERLGRKQKYYEHMFTSLETALGRIQSQNSFLGAQFTRLSGG